MTVTPFPEPANHHIPDALPLTAGGRVLQLTSTLMRTGGMESCIRRLSGDLVARGMETLVLSSDLSDPVDSFQTGWSARPLKVDDIASVLGEVQRFEPDVVVLHHLANEAVHRLLQGRYFTAQVVHTVLCGGNKVFRRHDSLCDHPVGNRCITDWYVGPCGSTRNPLTAVRTLAVARSHIRALGRADSVLVGSEFMRGYLMGEGIAAELVSVVDLQHDAVTDASSPRVRVETELWPGRSSSEDLYRLLFVGRMTYVKGLQYLIKALAQLHASFVLDVAGNGWYETRAKELVQELGLGGRVRFLGNVEEAALEAVYDRSDLLVVPSIWPEPVALVVGEARRRGLTVVVSDTGGLPEWAVGDSGVRVAPRADASGLAATLDAVRSGTAASSAPSRAALPPSPRLVDAVTTFVRTARG